MRDVYEFHNVFLRDGTTRVVVDTNNPGVSHLVYLPGARRPFVLIHEAGADLRSRIEACLGDFAPLSISGEETS
jgi:hypothetical protein